MAFNGLRFLGIMGALALLGATTAAADQTCEKGYTYDKKFESCVRDKKIPPGESMSDHACSADLNQYGFPSKCKCELKETYDPTMGECVAQEAGKVEDAIGKTVDILDPPSVEKPSIKPAKKTKIGD